MSENQNRGIQDFAQYDSMETEELEEILRLDAQAPVEQESDTEKILYIMEVLAQRNKNNGHTGKTALEAFESFKQNYMPETDHNSIPAKTASRYPRWARGLTAAAAVLVILLVGSFTSKAFGFDVWKAVIQWTQEAFHFGSGGNSNADNNLPYTSLQDALEQGNVDASLVPTWIPEGYSLADVTSEQSPLKKTYTAKYTNGEKVLVIAVRDYLGKGPHYVEQSDGLVEKYEVLGITYYLFENNKQVQAVWIVDSYECNVSGNITIDELKLMIDSIEKG